MSYGSTPKYKFWVKHLQCIVCQAPGPSDPHHLIGDGQGIMGATAPDELLMPLCRKHHDEIHAMTRGDWVKAHGVTQEQMVSKTIRRAVWEGWRMEQIT
jgi:hypothetical protein